jgi:predicted O-methyltransferase YrrM
MTNTLAQPRVQEVLGRLFAAAAHDEEAEPKLPPGRTLAGANAQERADALAEVYLPVSAAGGQLLYALTRASRPQTVVEFGTSFGISTIHLAAAIIDNGGGQMLTTELSPHKVQAAQANLDAAGVAGPVTILAGDAEQTLRDVPGPIGLVLLDGWKDLCLPVLRLLEPRLAPGAVIVGDDSTLASMGPYLEYVRDAAHGYVSVNFPVEDGMEISCWTGR